MAKGIKRLVSLVFDRASSKRAVDELIGSLGQAGSEGGKTFLRELRAQFDKRMAELRENLARGIIDQKEFKKQSEIAAKAFNGGLLKSMDEARKKGELTDREYIKLTKTLKKVGDDGSKAGNSLASTFGKAAGAVAGLFAVNRIVAFGESLFHAAAEADETWNHLAGTLEGVGIEFGTVETALRKQARAMQDTTTIGKEGFARVLGNLISISQDYAGSLRNVSLVADLAAARHIDLDTAATLVGKAMVGVTGTLKRFGIVVHEGDDAIEVMRARFSGMAANEVKTLGGQTKQLSNEWFDFKEALGRALAEAGGGTSIIAMLTSAVKSAGFWVEQNQQGFAAFASGLNSTVIPALQLLWFAFKGVVDIVTAAVLGVFGSLVESVAQVADGYATAADAAGAFVGLFSGKKRDEIKQHAAGIREHAKALREWADAAREVAHSTVKAAFSAGSALPNPLGPPPTPGKALPKPPPPPKPPTPADAKAADAAQAKEVDALKKAHEFRVLTVSDLDRAITLEKELAKQAANTNLSLAARATAAERAKTLRDIIALPSVGDIATAAPPAAAVPLSLTPHQKSQPKTNKNAPPPPLSLTDSTAGQGSAAEGLILQPDVAANEDAAFKFASPWDEALAHVAAEVEDSKGLFAELGDAWADGGLRGIARLVKGKVKENLARAIEELAKAAGAFALGDGRGAALHAQSAAQHTAAVAAWKLVGAAVGHGSGGDSGSSAAGMGAPGNTGGKTASTAQPKQALTFIIDGFNPKNGEHVRILGDGLRELGATESDFDIRFGS